MTRITKSVLIITATVIFTAFSYLPVEAAPKYYSYFGQEPTPKERELMKKYPSDAALVATLSKTATKYTLKYYKYNGEDDNSDAFRHCLWSALIKKNLGKKKAAKWTTAHEQKSKGLARKMDLYNNKIGRSVNTRIYKTKKRNGKSANEIIAERVKKKVESGKCRRFYVKDRVLKKLVKTNKSGLKR